MVSRDGNYMGLNGEGKPVFMPMEENYKEAVKWMRQLWEEGVVDPEYFTQDGSMQTAKQQADGGSQVGLIFGWTADAQVGPVSYTHLDSKQVQKICVKFNAEPLYATISKYHT